MNVSKMCEQWDFGQGGHEKVNQTNAKQRKEHSEEKSDEMEENAGKLFSWQTTNIQNVSVPQNSTTVAGIVMQDDGTLPATPIIPCEHQFESRGLHFHPASCLYVWFGRGQQKKCARMEDTEDPQIQLGPLQPFLSFSRVGQWMKGSSHTLSVSLQLSISNKTK